MSVDEALDELVDYRHGDNNEVVQVLSDAAVASFDDPDSRRALAAGLAGVLETKASYDAKQFACRQLALIGTEAHVPALGRLLADEKLSQMARYALARIPGEAADCALIDALRRTDGRNRLGVINTLGRRRCSAAIDRLADLADTGSADVTAEVARALARIGTPAAAEVLEGALADADDDIADAYLECADRLHAEGKNRAARAMYQRALDSDLPGHVRGAALKGLVAIRPAPAELIAALRSGDRQLQIAAAQIVRRVPNARPVAPLAEALPGLAPNVQPMLIRALAARGDAAALAPVTHACDSDNEGVRVAALEALGELGDAASVTVLLKAATEGSEAEQAAAERALARLDATQVDAALISRLDRAPATEEVEIVRTLTARAAAEAVPAFLSRAQSDRGAVRRAAIDGLAALAGQRQVPELVSLLADGQTRDRAAVRQMLVAVARRCGHEERTSKELVSQLDASRDAEVRGEMLLAMGELGQDAALPAIRQALNDDDPEVRRAAILALGQWPNAQPSSGLLDVARDDPDKTFRVLALRGYVDIVGRDTSMSAREKVRCYERALPLAANAAEKRRVFAVLPRIKTADALRLAGAFVDTETIRDESALAAVTIAKDVYGSDPALTKSVLQRVVAQPVRDEIRQEAQKLLTDIETLQSYLTQWEVAGPYMRPGRNHAQLFDVPFAPEQPDADVEWKPITVRAEGSHPAYVDLLAAFGGEQRVAYVRTEFEAAVGGAAALEIFSDDGVKAWLNGKLVHANNVARPIMPQPDRVHVTLQNGTNRLMLKVTQNNLPWGAIVRVRRSERTKGVRHPCGWGASASPSGATCPSAPAGVSDREKVPDPFNSVGKGWRLHAINAESRFEAAGILDVDRDGRLDIFCGGFWYEAPDWQRHFVREVPEQGGYHYDFANLPMDIDGDGWTDIVNAAWHNKTVFWLRNPGEQGGPWPVFDIDTPGNMETALAYDINGDGQTDVLPNIMKQAAWYEYHRDAAAPQGVRWEKHPLPQEAAGHGLGAGDVNGDGRCDIVTPRGWLEHKDRDWTWHPELALGHASIPILVHDVDADGDADLIWGLGHDYGLFWLEQQSGGGQRSWTRRLIDDSWSQPHFLLLADLDGDDVDELVTGKRYHAHNGKDPGGNDPPCVYYYDFDRATGNWARHTMHQGGRVGFGINTAAADMDDDGDIDIVAPGKSGLYLFENRSR
jgi:HEAT repeat protein